MDQDHRKSFLTYYLRSLYERTRLEKSGAKWGFDWVIYNLGLSLYGKPVRLPFLRTANGEYSKSKNEAEFGVDLSFLSEDHHTLTIFVLKDEPLTNRTWTDNDFLRDLEMASRPDLGAEGLAYVKHVVIILAYNKDDEANGIKAYDLFVRATNPTLRNDVQLRFERWNLSDLVEQTLGHLLTPALVPQRFFGQLSYLCAQAADFRHGSDPWEQQLVPAWKRFLQDVIGEGAGERGVALVPISLIIIRQHAADNPSVQTGIIDLTEWAAISLWRLAAESKDRKTKLKVMEFWVEFYIGELESFYNAQIPFLAAEQSIDQVAGAGYVGAVAASWIGYWHLGRLGLLSYSFSELLPPEIEDKQQERQLALSKVASWIAQLANANVCIYRPVLDIQHIEIFLAVAAFGNAGRMREAASFFVPLIERLYLRRIGGSDLPFLDGHNSLENVFEQVASKSEDKVIVTESSFFVLMLLELCCYHAPTERDELLGQIHRRLVLGAYDVGENENTRPIDLISWIPPVDWEKKVLSGYVDDGEVVSVQPFAESRDAEGSEIYSGIEHLISQMRSAPLLELKSGVPLGALILACLRHRSPLPPDLWRESAFPRKCKESGSESTDTG